jgi:hypothetical protein
MSWPSSSRFHIVFLFITVFFVSFFLSHSPLTFSFLVSDKIVFLDKEYVSQNVRFLRPCFIVRQTGLWRDKWLLVKVLTRGSNCSGHGCSTCTKAGEIKSFDEPRGKLIHGSDVGHHSEADTIQEYRISVKGNRMSRHFKFSSSVMYMSEI